MKRLVSIAAAALALSSAPAFADQDVANPFHIAFQGDVTVTEVSVAYRDDILRSHSDRASESFVEDSFTPEQRAAFEAFATPRGLTDAAYGERMSEYLATENLRGRFAALTGAHRIKVAVTVEEARINGIMSGALFGGAAFPRLAYSVRILDADTDALIATANVRNSQSYAAHNEEAARRNNLNYNFSGTDTNFRLLAGSTDALAQTVEAVLLAPGFGTSGTRVATYPADIRVPAANIEVTLSAQ